MHVHGQGMLPDTSGMLAAAPLQVPQCALAENTEEAGVQTTMHSLEQLWSLLYLRVRGGVTSIFALSTRVPSLGGNSMFKSCINMESIVI